MSSRLPWTVAVLVSIALAAAFSRTAMGARATGRPADGPAAECDAVFPQPGSVAPDFALPELRPSAPWVGSDTVRLSDFRGRWVYLDVFGSWCPPCRRKQPEMIEVAAELDARGASVVGLLLDDRPRAAAEWLSANGGMAYPYLVLDDETTRAWRITGAPMGFLISPAGRVERMCFGCSKGTDAVGTLPAAVR